MSTFNSSIRMSFNACVRLSVNTFKHDNLLDQLYFNLCIIGVLERLYWVLVQIRLELWFQGPYLQSVCLNVSHLVGQEKTIFVIACGCCIYINVSDDVNCGASCKLSCLNRKCDLKSSKISQILQLQAFLYFII